MTATLMKICCTVGLLVIYIGLLAPEVEALTCGHVIGDVAPCLGYLRNGGAPSPLCCNGVRGLRNQARTTADRRKACNCVKSAASSYRGVSGNYAASLINKCGAKLPYKISPSTPCNRIQ